MINPPRSTFDCFPIVWFDNHLSYLSQSFLSPTDEEPSTVNETYNRVIVSVRKQGGV